MPASPFDIVSWYDDFVDCTPRTVFVKDAPNEFYEYLAQDGIILAGGAPRYKAVKAKVMIVSTAFSEDEDTSESAEEIHSDEAQIIPDVDFPVFHQAIASAISDLGGKVFPKLGPSSPKVIIAYLPAPLSIFRMQAGSQQMDW